jgi:amino acid transporter
MPRTDISTAPWIYATLAISILFTLTGIAVLSKSQADWVLWGLVILLLLLILAVIDAAYTKIEAKDGIIVIRCHFHKMKISISSVEKVTWERSSGSFLTLTDGCMVKLPTTGRNEQGIVNSVRSWIKHYKVNS